MGFIGRILAEITLVIEALRTRIAVQNAQQYTVRSGPYMCHRCVYDYRQDEQWPCCDCAEIGKGERSFFMSKN